SYKIGPGRQEGNGRWHSTLYPPRLRGNAFLGWVRWQISVPHGWLPLSFEETFSPEQRWALRGWLPSLCPAVNEADLERWFYSGLDSSQAANAGSNASTAATDFSSDAGDGVVGWQSSVAALR